MEQINWEPILWLVGSFGSIIVLLLSGIVWFLVKHSNSLEARDDKHERWILKQQKQLNKLGKRTDISIEIIKTEQANNNERLRTFEQYLPRTKRRI